MSLQFTRIVADENIPKEIVQMLRDLGCKEVYWISEKTPGISDREVWRLAASKEAILVTRDVGFALQLSETELLQGPDVVEYSTIGFTKEELQDPAVMKALIRWLLENGYHEDREHIRIHIEGTVSTRRQIWQREKHRRKVSS